MLYGAGFWTSETQNRNQAIDEMSGQKTKTKNIYIHETYHVASGQDALYKFSSSDQDFVNLG